MYTRKSYAFTLAEVLITLGIIGIVAAITVPTLMVKINSVKFANQFKKSLATASQAARIAYSNYDMDYGVTTEKCDAATGGSEAPSEVLSFCSLFNGTLTAARFLGTLDNVEGYSINARELSAFYSSIAFADGEAKPKMSTDPSDYLAYQIADGSLIAFNKDAVACSLHPGEIVTTTWIANHMKCVGFLDVNGTTTPNTVVNCDGVDSLELDVEGMCTVPGDYNHTTDIYPVLFYDGTVRPITQAGRFVIGMFKSTSNTEINKPTKTD